MRSVFLFLVLSFFSILSAEDALIDLSASKDENNFALPPATLTAKDFSTFNPHLPKVNVVTGEYFEEECDLIVVGTEPLSYRRFYGNKGFKDRVYGHWRINLECFMLFNFEMTLLGYQTFKRLAACGERDGSFLLYEKDGGNQFSFSQNEHKSFTHFGLSGQNHPLNTKVTYEKIKKKKDDTFFYQGTVQNGSGGIRYFCSHKLKWATNKGDFTTFPAPPYPAKVVLEKTPSGNLIEYSYIDLNEGKTVLAYDALTQITAYNASKTVVLGYIQIQYGRGGKEAGRPIQHILVSGSDGRSANLIQEPRKVKAKTEATAAVYDTVLREVNACWKPTQGYQYRWEESKSYYKARYLFQAYQDQGRVLETTYDLVAKKVTAQSAPVGPNGEMVPIAQYAYYDDHTIVSDGEYNKTIYRFNGDKCIVAIEKFQDGKIYSIERNSWDPLTGNLVKKTIEDSQGKLFSTAEYLYDKNHNVVEEKVGDDVILRTFSDDGFNLKLTESDREGKLIKYTYLPNTNLLSSELVLNHGKICKRTFHFYDSELNSVRVKTVVDDGKSENPQDLSLVTYRQILEITPRRKLPCVGLPEQVKEKTLDHSGNEMQVSRVVYTYHPSGKILREDHFDAQDAYSYCIENTYDQKERLVATKDALGNTTKFAYDTNFNLIEQRGPLADMRKEWIYDKANRPIEEKEWQSDGSILVRKKKYDKASRLIATLDESGFETKYTYDALDRLTTVLHPDGSSEKRDYDVLGNVILETDANGYTTKKNHNSRGQPTAIYYPDDSEEKFFYEPKGGRLIEQRDKQGTKTLYFYDIFDRVIGTEVYSKNGELLKATKMNYSPFSLLSESDGEGHVTSYQYDFAGRKIAEDKNGKKKVFFYDAQGNLARTLDGDAVIEENFDFKGQLIARKLLDLKDVILEEETYRYDPAGNQTHVINSKGISEILYNTNGLPLIKKDPLGFATTFSYSYKNGLISKETDPLGIQTEGIHDCRGNEILFCKKNAEGKEIQKVERRFDGNKNLIQETQYVFKGTDLLKTITHTWVYGPCNRLEKSIESGQKETRYLYDNTGKQIKVIKPDLEELLSEYDAFSRLARYYSTDFDYRYQYDKNDQILSVFDSHSKTKTLRSYDPLGNITQEIFGNGLVLSSTFDLQGRRQSITYPDGSQASFAYHANRLHDVERKGMRYVFAERDLEGNVSKIELPAKLGTISIERDPLSRWKKTVSPYYSSVFGKNAYDSVGNLLHYQYTDALGTKTCNYTYDDLRQLTAENTDSYNYDSLHNRIAKNHEKYAINDLCEITHDGTTPYTYDANGNLLSYGSKQLTYDSQGRLIAVQDGDAQTLYSYDAFNRRLSKTSKGKKELYFYDGDQEIGKTNEKGQIQELRVLGEGLGAEIGAAVFVELMGKIYIPFHDHRGCVVALVDSNQQQETYRYTAFGEELTSSSLSPWRFASKRVDPETGFVYFGRRYYCPPLGRWVTPDPQGFNDGPNLYAYLHNCPLNDFDLYGLWGWNSMYGAARNYGLGIREELYNAGFGIGHSISKAGQLRMYTDPQYAYFNERSLFKDASSRIEDWKTLGHNLRSDSLSVAFPGVMEAWRNPTSAKAWGKATVDIALLGFAFAKMGRAANNLSKAGRISAEFETLAKTGNVQFTNLSSISPKNSLAWEKLINPFKGKSFQEIDYMLTNKGFYKRGPNPPMGQGSYFHPVTNRKYYLDHAGKTYRKGVKELPHVDIHYTNPWSSRDKRRFPIGEDLHE